MALQIKAGSSWKDQVSTPDKVLERIKPGMRIALGTRWGTRRYLNMDLLKEMKKEEVAA